MASEDLREIILGHVGYDDIALPKTGTVRMHPYVSGRAMDAYVALAENPKAAFRSMVAASVEDTPGQVRPELPDEDAEVIAQLYAEKEGFLEPYLKARQEKDTYDAFYTAFSSTEHWQQWKRSQERLEAQLNLHARLIPKSLDLITRDVSRIVSEAQRISIPIFHVPDLSAWLDTRSIALQLSSTALLPKLTAVEQFSTLAKVNLDNWSGLTQHLKVSEQFHDLIGTHFGYLDELTKRTSLAEELLRSHTEVFSSFNKVAEAFRAPQFPNLEHVQLLGKAFTGSDHLVRSVSDYFSQEPARPRSIQRPTDLIGPYAQHAYDADQQIEEAADQTEDMIHGTAEEVILIGNDAISMLMEIIGTAIDEKISPYAPILNRMKLLASPKSFLETLQAFALHFQREHWKDLWSEQGKKYNSRPESIARLALSMFLLGHCQGAAFVGKELGNGDGFVDMLVNYLGINYVVEVKIIGASWGVGYAKAGLDQLDAYIQNYDTAPGYLLVFDGRVSTKGEQLQPEYTLKSGATAHVVVIRSYFDKPSA